MKYKFTHYNFNVQDMEKSLKFYEQALGLKVSRTKKPDDGSFILNFLKDDYNSPFELELTWMRDHEGKYDLGDQEFHLGFDVDDYEGAFRLHKEMGCVCYENIEMGIYFIEDPDGYWIEICPPRRRD